jgi:hypothetical protein
VGCGAQPGQLLASPTCFSPTCLKPPPSMERSAPNADADARKRSLCCWFGQVPRRLACSPGQRGQAAKAGSASEWRGVARVLGERVQGRVWSLCMGADGDGLCRRPFMYYSYKAPLQSRPESMPWC